jgi:hypothetical protein
MQRTILRFQNNAPVTVKLDRADGKETQSKISGEPQWMYTVNDDANVIYLGANARNQLLKTGAQAGDMVEIVKRVEGKSTSWGVQVLSDAAEPSFDARNGSKACALPRSAPAARNGHVNGHAAPDSQQAYPDSHPFEERYARMFVCAAHALQMAHKQLEGEGFELDFPNWEDIRATAIHFAISFERKEERR